MDANKSLIGVTIIGWLNIGLFYSLYVFEIENVIIGVFRELTIIPSYLLGIICPVILVVKAIYKATNRYFPSKKG